MAKQVSIKRVSVNSLMNKVLFIEKYTEHILDDYSSLEDIMDFVEEYYDEAKENKFSDLIDIYIELYD